MSILSDTRLSQLIDWRVPGLTRLLARRAAARALHAPALAGAPHDAVVLALLGLFADAPDGEGEGRAGRRARMIATAAQVTDGLDGAAGMWPLVWRRRLAAVVAPRVPLAAAALLNGDPLAAAACLLAAGAVAAATALATSAPAGAELALIRGALAMQADDRAAATQAINGCFAATGLAGPIASVGLSLDAYDGAAAVRPIDGPLVSVIVPMHNDGATIATAIRSLQRQSWCALEIIVSDDRSSDDGPAVVARLAAADPRIRLIASDGAPGASGTRNSAIGHARGRFIAFLDADDWAHPVRIERQMETLGERAATVSAHYRVDAEGIPMAPRVFPLLRLCPISMVVRRAVLDQVGGFDCARAGADAELLGRLDTVFGRAAVPRDRAPLTVALWRPKSISNDQARGLHDRERLIYRSRWMRAHAHQWATGGLPVPVPA